MACPLTPDAIMAISLRGAQDLHPLVQVIDIRQIGSAQERFRLILSDSVHLQQAMLATQLNEDVTSGKCLKGSCVRLREYICNTVQNKKIIIVLSMDVEIQNADIYGTPVPVPVVDDKADTGSGSCQQNPNQAVPPPIPQPSWQQPAQQSTQQTFMTSNALKTGSGMSIGNMNSSVAANNGWGKPLGSSNGTSGFQVSRGMGSGPSPTGAAVGFAGGSGVGSGSGFGNMGGEGAGAYGRHGMSFSNQPAPMFSSRGPIVKNEAPARVVPIKSLSPYQGRWTIKVRVTSKTDKRKFNKAQSTGTVFSFDLLDQDKGEIRATAFNEVAEKLYNLVHVGHVYILSKGTLKAAQPKYNQLNNPWELTLDGSSILEPVADDFLIPQQVFSFVPICNIEDMENNKMVDIVGIVVAINPTTTITRKNGSDTQKRSLHLRDMSGKSVEVTMWGDFCNREGLELQELCDSGQYPVLLVKAGRISDFNGKSVGTISSTLLSINPDMTEARRLREWFDREGKNLNCQSVSKEGGTSARSELRKTIGQIKDEGLGRGDKPDWITVKATVYFVKEENFFYPACPLKSGGDRQCNKKLTNMGDGTWRCEKCGQDVSECDYRYLLAVQVQDDTGQTWLTAFQEGGEDIMGISAKDLNQLKLDGDPKYGEIFSKVNFSQRLFKLKVKEEHYNDEQRVKCTVVRSEKLDFAQECQLLVDLIGKIDRGEPIHSISVNGGGGGFKGVFPVNGGDSGRQTTSLIGGSAPAPYNNLGYLQSSYDRSNTNDGAAKTGCFKCGSEGHYARDCPNAAASASSGGGFDYGFSGRGSGARGGGGFDNSFSGGSGGRGGGTNTCYKCGQPGHWANSCPSNESGGGGGRSYSGGQGGRGGGRGTGYGGGGYNTGGYSGF